MTEKVKTGLCVLTLLLAVLAACVQEITFRGLPPARTAVQPAPFAAVRMK